MKSRRNWLRSAAARSPDGRKGSAKAPGQRHLAEGAGRRVNLCGRGVAGLRADTAGGGARRGRNGHDNAAHGVEREQTSDVKHLPPPRRILRSARRKTKV